MTYEIGQTAELIVNFTDANGNPADPTGVSLIVRDPAGAQITYTGSITHLDTGQYQQNITPTLPGIYNYQWTGTGTVTAVIQDSITCAVSLLQGTIPNAIDLTSLDVVKSMLQIAPDNTKGDAAIARAITQASLFWLKQTSRMPDSDITPLVSPFVQVCSFNEWFDGNGSNIQFVKNPPIRSITVVAASTSIFPAASYQIGYSGAAVILKPGSSGFIPTFRPIYGVRGNCFPNGIQNINIQYQGGYDGVPWDVGNACAEMIVLTIRKRGWIGQKSIALAQGGGTTSYQTWVVEPWVRTVMNNYTRKAIV